MIPRACTCGRVNCTVHGRRSRPSAGDYGAAHQERRRRLLAEAARNPASARCGRCGQGTRQDDPWEAGHIIDAVLGGGPDVRLEHRSCNRAAGARTKAQIAKQRAKQDAEERARRRVEATYRILEGSRG